MPTYDPKRPLAKLDKPNNGNATVPMDNRGEKIKEAGFRRMLRYMSEGGTNVFVGGPHATEFVNMDRKERTWLWEVAVDELKGKGMICAIPFGPASTTEMVAFFKQAKSMGFDGAQLYPGAQEGRGGDGMYIREAERYYRDVLEAVPGFPMFVCGYHGGEVIDSPTKAVPLELLLQLLKDYPHIAGITGPKVKDNAELKQFVQAVGGKRPVRTTGHHDWYGRLEAGLYGFHTIQPSMAPRLCSTMLDAYHSGDKKKAKELSDVIERFGAIIHGPGYNYPRTIKPISNFLGLDMGIIRRPYLPPPQAQQDEMCKRVAALDLGQYEKLPKKRVAAKGR